VSLKSLLIHRATLLRLDATDLDGVADYGWVEIGTEVRCRADLSFMRRGKDAGWVAEAGRSNDRAGVLFLGPDVDVRPGDRVRVTSARGRLIGTFELDGAFDTVDDRLGEIHHVEAGITEVATAFADAIQFGDPIPGVDAL